MEKGNLDMTVFQDAKGQGRVSMEVAAKLAKGEQVDSFIWIPFRAVTKGNYKEFPKRRFVSRDYEDRLPW